MSSPSNQQLSVDVNELIKAMLEQNRLREEQIRNLVDKLMGQSQNYQKTMSFVPNHLQLIQNFDGETGDTDVADEWLSTLCTADKLNNWPDTYTMEAARSNLSGPARQWYLSHMADLKNFDDFSKLFKVTFTSEESITNIWKRMYDRVQGEKESVFNYYHEKVRLCRKLKLNEDETKKMVCVGLRSRDLVTALLSSSRNTEPELLADIRMFMEVQAEHSGRVDHTRSRETIVKPGTTSTTYYKWHKTKPNEQGNLNIPTGLTKTNNFKPKEYSPKCYNCQLFGHIARDCTRTKRTLKCSKCSIEGHTAKYCTATKSEVILVNSNPHQKPTNCYIKPVFINNNNEPVSGLVDTGSAFSIIRKSVADKFKLVVTPKEVKMWVYGNSQPVTSCGKSQATLCVDTVKELVECVIVDDELQKYDVIVGRTFVDKENVTFIKTSDQLHFAYGMKFPFEDSEVPRKEENLYTAITTRNFEEIPPRSVKITNVATQDNDIEVLIVNDGDEPVTWSKGKIVCNVKNKIHSPVHDSFNSCKTITTDMVNYNPEFSEGQVNKLLDLINSYRMCFAFSAQELGCTNVVEMDIVDNGVPVVC